jgi:hypothetical protein
MRANHAGAKRRLVDTNPPSWLVITLWVLPSLEGYEVRANGTAGSPLGTIIHESEVRFGKFTWLCSRHVADLLCPGYARLGQSHDKNKYR